MIRPAKFFDIMRIVELLNEMQAKSRYKSVDQVDDKTAHALLANAVHRHGNIHAGGTYLMVAIRDQKVEGFMMGALDRTYHIGKKLMAQDVFLYLSDKADPIDALRLVSAYVKWASGNPKVVEIKLSWTDALEGAEGVETMYEHFGFRRCGAVWSRENMLIEAVAEEEAVA